MLAVAPISAPRLNLSATLYAGVAELPQLLVSSLRNIVFLATVCGASGRVQTLDMG